MQRDRIIYAIQKIPDSLKQQYPELKSFNLYQYFGSNANTTLVYSIICYCLLHQLDNILAKFSQPKISYRNHISFAIAKCVKESATSNIFLEKLKAVDTNGVKGEILLKEFCQINNLVNFKGQIHSEKLASFLDLKIIFLPSGQYYGEGGRQMYMLEHQREIYFLLPFAKTDIKEVSSRILRSCFKCGKTTRDYFTPPCQHHICMPCIVRLALPSTGNYRCNYPACKQIVLYRTLLQFQEEQICKKELEERKQYDIAVSQPPITIKSEQSFSEPKDSMVWVRCQKCSAEINYKPITVQGCGHRFCLQCSPEKGVQTQCPLDGCNLQKYLQNKSQVQMSKCFQCLLSKSINEQFVNDCGHTICNICINKNIYVPRMCSYCYKQLNNKEYQEYKDRMLLQCDGCKEEYQTQNLYKNILCDHLVCFKCISKGMRKDQVYCIAGCSKLLLGKEFIRFFEQQQNKQLELSVLQLKEEEIKKQKEADELKKQKEIDEKNKQLDEYNEQKQKTESDEQKQEKVIDEQKNKGKKSFREESLSAHTKSNADQVADSLKHSKLIKVHSVQDYSLSKIEQQPSSAKQLSVIKESEIKQPEQKQQSQLAVQQQSDLDNSPQIQEILFQNLQYEGECTMCFTQFSQFNLRQPLQCKEHQIGVCCIRNFKVCPQCERKGAISTIRVKEKLILQKFIIQEEYQIQDSPKINKYSENNYFEKSAIYQPKTEKYNQYKDLLPQPSYQIDRQLYERPVQRFTSTVGQQRFQSMDPRYSRYPVSSYQQSRQQIGLPF